MILNKIVLIFIFQSVISYAAEGELLKGKNICLAPTSNTIQVCDAHILGFSTESLNINKTHDISENMLIEDGSSKKNLDIYNYIQTPESDTDWGSYILSGLAILFSVGTAIWQRYTQKNDAINDGFWVREVVMPQINNGVINLSSGVNSKLKLNPADFTTAYQNDLLPLLNELRDSFSLLSAFPNATAYAQKLNYFCDNFDDVLSDNINKPIEVRLKDVSDFRINITKELMVIHKKIT